MSWLGESLIFYVDSKSTLKIVFTGNFAAGKFEGFQSADFNYKNAIMNE